MLSKREIVLGIFLISLFLPYINPVTANFLELEPNTTYTYEVKTSKWDIIHGSKEAHSVGLQFMGTQYAEDTEFSVETKDIEELEVTYDLTFGSETISSKDTNDTSCMYTFYGLHILLLFINASWNQAIMDMGPPLLTPYFFFHEDSFNKSYKNDVSNILIEGIHLLDYFTSGGVVGSGVHFEEKRSTFLISFDNSIDYHDAEKIDGVWVYYTKYLGRFKTKLEYDKTTGVLMGYNLFLDINGTIPGTTVDFIIEQKVEAKGFNIGGFGLGSLSVFTFLLSLSTLLITSAIIKKKKA